MKKVRNCAQGAQGTLSPRKGRGKRDSTLGPILKKAPGKKAGPKMKMPYFLGGARKDEKIPHRRKREAEKRMRRQGLVGPCVEGVGVWGRPCGVVGRRPGA